MFIVKNLSHIKKVVNNINNYNMDINLKSKNGYTALMLASKYSNTESNIETVKLLLDNGADINLKNCNGNSALMLASKYLNTDSNIETIKLLLDNGADIDVKNNNGTSFYDLNEKLLNYRPKKKVYTTDKCCICLSEYSNNQIIIYPCGHTCCEDCYNELVKNNNKCHICKSIIKDCLLVL